MRGRYFVNVSLSMSYTFCDWHLIIIFILFICYCLMILSSAWWYRVRGLWHQIALESDPMSATKCFTLGKLFNITEFSLYVQNGFSLKKNTYILKFGGRVKKHTKYLLITMCDTLKIFNKRCACLVTQTCPTLVTLWTSASQAPLSMGILQARTLEWVPKIGRAHV